MPSFRGVTGGALSRVFITPIPQPGPLGRDPVGRWAAGQEVAQHGGRAKVVVVFPLGLPSPPQPFLLLRAGSLRPAVP